MDAPAAISVQLSDEERSLLRAGLAEWGGPARPTEELSVAMGFGGLAEMSVERKRLAAAVANGDALSAADWSRVLVATEFVFVSDRFGSGLDWPITTGFSDAETIALLRQLQRKLPRWRPTAQFRVSDQGGVSMLNSDRPNPE